MVDSVKSGQTLVLRLFWSVEKTDGQIILSCCYVHLHICLACGPGLNNVLILFANGCKWSELQSSEF